MTIASDTHRWVLEFLEQSFAVCACYSEKRSQLAAVFVVHSLHKVVAKFLKVLRGVKFWIHRLFGIRLSFKVER
jgi:hypothetical protein